MELDFSAEQFGKFFLNPEESKSRLTAFFELHEYVHITIGTEVVPQNRPKNGKPADMMTPTQISNPVFRHSQILGQLCISLPLILNPNVCSVKVL